MTADCQIWGRGCGKAGYPMRWDPDAKQMIYVHSEVCEWAHGPRPAGAEAAHNCGTRACINPEHLRWATHVDNMADQIAHGRSKHPGKHQHGERNAAHKLTAEDVLAIRAIGWGATDDVGDAFGVNGRTVRSILRRDSWSNV